jgi:hypothetical protein
MEPAVGLRWKSRAHFPGFAFGKILGYRLADKIQVTLVFFWCIAHGKLLAALQGRGEATMPTKIVMVNTT